ncbi:KR domain [Geosmithia morbida]|uniref:KR domain n=1 Tax=Geosmithia morbida TaxID=1094350 RepID=A0A9P4YSM6_9HYPO|nr:KR domain [Geosmithia morbida]KAF4122040.1 KR domain [Geosmithia morbida]
MMQANHHSTVLLATLLLPVPKVKSPPPGEPGVSASSTWVHWILAQPADRHKTSFLAALHSSEGYGNAVYYPDSKAITHSWMFRLAEEVSPEDVVVDLGDLGVTDGIGAFDNIFALVCQGLLCPTQISSPISLFPTPSRLVV